MLIPNWIEHNDEHAEEYRRWAESAAEAAEASVDLLAAVDAMKRVNQTLAVALEKLGGALPLPVSH
jgi:hypothetical protein